ncbi:MAG: nitrogenase cofactor biosynthesis protein NifB [Methermicoccaceae archaeon]
MDSEKYPVADVKGKKVPWDATQLRRIQEHPCFSEDACHLFGRMHLAVAPDCNIQCNYCVREFDCVNESRPGVTSKVLTPQEAIERVRTVITKYPHIKVVAVAGPGEPLFNEETFEALRLVHEEFPRVLLCLSTNGLFLPEKIDELDELGVGNITVTLNAVDPAVGEHIYSWVNWHGKRYTGKEGAEILLKNQLKGLEMAVEKEMVVKVNTVLIPTVNDQHIVEVAKTIGGMGVYMQNIIPLIPQYKFAHIAPPTLKEKGYAQQSCSDYVKQMTHCRHCRADAIGKLGEDIQEQLFPKGENKNKK